MGPRFIVLLILALLGAPAMAQTTGVPQPPSGTRVSGIVHDSIASGPLVGAIVQLANADDPLVGSRSTLSDSLGRFVVDDVPAGRYLIGFMHPMLDSLRMELPLRVIEVGGQPVRTDLAIPGPERLRAAICGPLPANDSGAVVTGFVRDAVTMGPVPGATVVARWLELTLGAQGITTREQRLVATTQDEGWFAMCGIAREITIGLVATRGADSTALLDVEIPATGFARRELFLGEAQTMLAADTGAAQPGDSLAQPPRRIQVGAGRLRGTVVRAADGKPLPDAQVSIVDGPYVRTNAQGEWTLANAPAGTRVLEVRALGYYPVRRPVDVVGEAPPLRVALSTFKAVMDTVKVTATRFYDRRREEFERRRRASAGHFLSADDIAKRRPIYTSDLLRMVPGVRLSYQGGFGRAIQMRGTFAGMCTPSIYIDGMPISDMDSGTLDSWIRPEDIVGMEIYSVASVPAQYQALNGCGAILFWTR